MNKVVLLGGDHHNGLGLVRSFGQNGLKPYGIIIKNKNKKSFVAKSRYWEKVWVLSDEKEAVQFLMDEFKDEKEKPVVIPWSDPAAAEIDNNLDSLRSYFIVPSLGETQGAVVRMMDKQRQIEFIEKYGLPMARSWTIPLPYRGEGGEFVYPCICKPVSSYEGAKIDITKCCNSDELLDYLAIICKKGYKRILVQEYIKFDRELEFVGCCDNNPGFIISHNLRNWPIVGGTNSYLQLVNDDKISSVCQQLLEALQAEKYFGLFDIELFQVGERILVNEINWRNTGNSFFSLGTNVHYAVIWYYNAIGIDTSSMNRNTGSTAQYAMNESTDLRHVIFGELSFSKWIKDLKRTQCFALWYRKDIIPTIYQYIYLLKELVYNRRNG